MYLSRVQGHALLLSLYPLEAPVSIFVSTNSLHQSLISHSHHNRTTLGRQMEEVRVSVATNISQTFTLNVAGAEIRGSPVRGQVSLSHTEDLLNLLMTEDCVAAKYPPYELVSLIADACGIEDPNHYSLLYTALSSPSLERISSTFTQQGIYIKGLVFGTPRKFAFVPKLICGARQAPRKISSPTRGFNTHPFSILGEFKPHRKSISGATRGDRV